MERIPSARIRKKSKTLNLIPFSGTVLAFVFFILMSATFYHVSELGTAISIADLNHKTNLKLKMTGTELTLVSSGSVIEKFERLPNTGDYNFSDLRSSLKNHASSESSITLEPDNELSFEEISRIMNVVKDQFTHIAFGNLK